MKKIILIDGNSIIFRSFYATAYKGEKGLLKTSNGNYTNALVGFIKMINTIIKNKPHSHLLVLFDTGKPTFRNQIDEIYKSSRKKAPVELIEQFKYIYDFLDIVKIKYEQQEGFEADDLIGSYALKFSNKGYDVEIFSGDKDLFQLISEKVHVNIFIHGATDIKRYGISELYEKSSVNPYQFIELLALSGDASDDIKGLTGVGEKTAISLLNDFSSIDGIYKNIDKISKPKLKQVLINEKDKLDTYFKLAKIKTDVNIFNDENDLIYDQINFSEELDAFFKKYELISLMVHFQKNKIEKDLFSVMSNENEEKIKYINDDDKFSSIIAPKMSFYLELDQPNYHIGSFVGLGCFNGKEKYIIDFEYIKNNIKLKEYFNDEKYLKIVFDFKKTYVFLSKFNYKFSNNFFDIMLANYLIDPNKSSNDLSLIAIVNNTNLKFLDKAVYTYKKDKIVLEKDNINYNLHIIEKASVLYDLYDKLNYDIHYKKLDELLYNIEQPLCIVLAKMEIEGINVNKKILFDFIHKYQNDLNLIEKEIYKLAGVNFNISSPKQLAKVLFKDLKLNSLNIKSNQNGFSTDKETLEQLQGSHLIIDYILNYRTISKLLQTYLNGILDFILTDNKIHTIYTQALTKTGRLSSLYPNLQNIPTRTNSKEIRSMYDLNQDYLYYSYDYSQVELRLLAHLSKDKHLIEEFRNETDIHSQTAKKIFNTNFPTTEQRRIAKAVNFGIIYGITPFGLSKDLKISFKQAKDYILKHKLNYPDVHAYMNEITQFASENGFVKTIFGRIRYIENINSNNKLLREQAVRFALNAPIQGSAADIIKIAMIKINKFLEENNLDTKLVLQIHDELIFKVNKNEEKIIADNIPKIMTDFLLDIPLRVSLSKGKDLILEDA